MFDLFLCVTLQRVATGTNDTVDCGGLMPNARPFDGFLKTATLQVQMKVLRCKFYSALMHGRTGRSSLVFLSYISCLQYCSAISYTLHAFFIVYSLPEMLGS